MNTASLIVGGGVRLITPAKLYCICARKNHYNHSEDGRTAPGVRGHSSATLNHAGSVVTRIRLQKQQLMKLLTPR